MREQEHSPSSARTSDWALPRPRARLRAYCGLCAAPTALAQRPTRTIHCKVNQSENGARLSPYISVSASIAMCVVGILAKASVIATLTELYDRRLALGVGSGSDKVQSEAPRASLAHFGVNGGVTKEGPPISHRI